METKVGYKRCAVCGAEYKLGPNCAKLRESGVMSWKHTADTHECFQVFCVLKDYKDGAMSTENANKALVGLLAGIDYSGYDEISKTIIDEIMAVEVNKPEEGKFFARAKSKI